MFSIGTLQIGNTQGRINQHCVGWYTVTRVVLSPPIPFLWAHNSHSGNYEFIVLIFFNLLGNVLVVRIRKKLFGHLPGMFKCHIIGSYHMKKLFRRTKSSTVFSSV